MRIKAHPAGLVQAGWAIWAIMGKKTGICSTKLISRGNNMKFILIKTNLEFEVVNIDFNCFLQKCYELIDCNCIEVCVPRPFSGCLRYIVDDCGKLNGQPFNLLATVFYDREDHIFGNVILGTIAQNEFGELDVHGLADEQCNLLCKYLSALRAELIY